MRLMLNELFVICLVATWGIQHSLLASNKVKRKFGVDPLNRWYRIGYIVVSILTLIGLEMLISIVLLPQGTKFAPFIDILTFNGKIVYYILLITAWVIGLGAFIQINPLAFFGIMREKPSSIKIKLFYRFSRHPMYAGVFLGLTAGILISTNRVDLVKIISYMSYLTIGARFEEKRMKTNMEGYDIMYTRGFFFPYRAKHFQILLGRDISSEKKNKN